MAKHAQLTNVRVPDFGGMAWGSAGPVKVSVDVLGVQELHKYWRQLPMQIRRAAGWGADLAAKQIFAAADDTVPFRHGFTMESGRIQDDFHNVDTSVIRFYDIVYDTEYAWKIHEAVGWEFGQPGDMKGWGRDKATEQVPPSKRGWRGAKWLEKAMEEYAPQYEDIVTGAIQAMLAEQEALSRSRIPQTSGGTGKAPPRLVKKGQASGGVKMADVPVFTPPKPPQGNRTIEEIRQEATAMTWAQGSGVAYGDD